MLSPIILNPKSNLCRMLITITAIKPPPTDNKVAGVISVKVTNPPIMLFRILTNPAVSYIRSYTSSRIITFDSPILIKGSGKAFIMKFSTR